MSNLRLKLVCKNYGTANKLASVLAPDNKVVPADQRLLMVVKSDTVLFKVESDRLPSALATVQSILQDVSLFQEIWLISQKKDA
ncbi:MAG: hypothetical protein LYZ66_00975 [Nitrososphaerales archaeon]|nr:hypothetical protein [Nitrososphaerales archaeon]